MAKANNHKMIRVPAELADRIERLQEELLRSYEEGRTSRVQLTEQGSKGAWVSKGEVIRLALDELEDHKARLSEVCSTRLQSTDGRKVDIDGREGGGLDSASPYTDFWILLRRASNGKDFQLRRLGSYGGGHWSGGRTRTLF